MKKGLPTFFARYWDALIASSLVFVLIALFTKHSGIGISPDSVEYLSVANHIVERFSFTDFNNEPFVLFPLGYPIFLVLIKCLSPIAITNSLPVVNALIFSAILFCCSSILKASIKSNGMVRLLILLLLACSPALLEVYTMLWSETFFILISLFFVLAAKKYLHDSAISSLILLACISAIGFSVRYVGIVFILTGSVFILFNPQLKFLQKILHGLLLGFIGASLAIINLARNAMVSGTYTGVREKAIRGIWDNLQDVGLVIGYWFPIPETQQQLTVALLILFLVMAFSLVVYHCMQAQYYARYSTIIALFFLVYIFFMLITASVSRFETLSSRLMSPIFIPIILLLALWVNRLMRGKIKTVRVLIVLTFLGIYSFVQFHQYKLNRDTWEGVGAAGIPGYSEDQWTKSPMVSYIKKDIEKYQPPVLANANDALYYLSGINSVALPHKDIPTEIEQFKQIQHFYLIWFFYGENDDLIDLTYILQQKKPVASWQFKDGIIYRF
ncbi:MAG: hypothetical protein Q8K64_15365 [Sediminibacterium sp.]|nr:hypothetical protein [Sediminibacterium sp.]